MENIDTKTKFVELRAKGNSFNSIAETLGVSKQTLINWSKSLQIDIANLKAFEYDELINKYRLNKEFKLKAYRKMLNKLEQELEKRDLSEVKTERLFSIYLKIFYSLSKEVIPVSFGEQGVWDLTPETIKWEA